MLNSYPKLSLLCLKLILFLFLIILGVVVPVRVAVVDLEADTRQAYTTSSRRLRSGRYAQTPAGTNRSWRSPRSENEPCGVTRAPFQVRRRCTWCESTGVEATLSGSQLRPGAPSSQLATKASPGPQELHLGGKKVGLVCFGVCFVSVAFAV